MSDPLRPDDLRAAEYALGLLRGDERRAMEVDLATDDALRSRVTEWQSRLRLLDDAKPSPVPDALFERIMSRIKTEGLQRPGTVTKRSVSADWLDHSPGITYRVLSVDERLKRQSLLVRMQPGAIYKSHAHDVDEECLVIEGDLQFGDLVLRAGDFHLATPAMAHPTGRTTAGCLLHVVVGLEI
jgi:anti-sigma factor ChrR (cupin superfamily)